MYKNIVISILALLLIGTYILYSATASSDMRNETRINACRNLAIEIDELFREERESGDEFVDTISNYLTYHISYQKAEHKIDELIKSRGRRDYRYNLARDKYEHICFEID